MSGRLRFHTPSGPSGCETLLTVGELVLQAQQGILAGTKSGKIKQQTS